MSIYKIIKNIAKRKKVTHKEFAKALGVTETQVTNYLNGRSKIIADHIPLFAKLLRVPIEELFSEGSYDKKLELKQTNESGVKYFSCPDCIEKQKEIGAIKNKLVELQEKYIDCLEELQGKKSKNCG